MKVPKTRTIIVVLLIVILAFYIFYPRAPPVIEDLVIAHSSDADYLDIHQTLYDSATRVIGLIGDSLLTFDENMNYVPLLADSYDIDPSGLSITFYLRDDVTFHCGYPFNADAVKYSVERARDWPKSKHRASVARVREIETFENENYVVRIWLYEQDRYLLPDWFATTSSIIVCPHCVEEYKEDYGTSGGHVCGTGPFKFKEWILNDRIILERNEDYTWGPSTYTNRGPAKLRDIGFRVIPEDLVREAEFEAGEVNFVVSIDPRPTLVDSWTADPNINFIERPKSSMVYVGFNVCTLSPEIQEVVPSGHRHSPLNDDPEGKGLLVRKAIMYATHKENLLLHVYQGMGGIAYGPLTTMMWGYNPAVENLYPYDPEKARDLLVEAGYPDGLDLEIITTSAPPYPRLAEVLKAQLEVVGIDLSIQVLDFAALIDEITKANHDMFIMGYTWHSPDMIWWEWHTVRVPPGPNRWWWGDAYSDAVIDNTFSFNDDVAREALYESQMLIMENAVFMPVVERALLQAHRAEVKGYEVHPLGDWAWKHLDTYIERE